MSIDCELWNFTQLAVFFHMTECRLRRLAKRDPQVARVLQAAQTQPLGRSCLYSAAVVRRMIRGQGPASE